MAKAKKNTKTHPNKRYTLLVSVMGALLLLAFGFLLRSYLIEKQTLNDLSVTNEYVRELYQRMLIESGDNVASSSFSNTCSESSVEIGRGRIVCWVGGTLVLKSDIGFDSAARVMEKSVEGNALNSSTKSSIYNGQYYKGVSISYRSPYPDITCDGSYAQGAITKAWSYSVSCRKDVPNFLPGYTVEE